MIEMYGVSRTVVREAITWLSAAGIVETGNGRRPCVAKFDPGVLANFFSHGLSTNEITTAQIMEARRGVEMESVRLAALRRDTENLERLFTILEKMENSTSDQALFVELDVEFHLEIAAAAKNQVLSYMIVALRKPIVDTIKTSFSHSKADTQWLKKVHQDHALIANLIREQKVEAVVMAMQNHLDQSLSAQNFWVLPNV
jgi:DNA-binding FadR family transcriptional regulator